jgi:hypothetical protein
MSTVTVEQITWVPTSKLPLHPEELVGLDPSERGAFYNQLELCSFQRACAEEARRLVLADNYGAKHG